MIDRMPTPGYLRQRARALRDLCQQTGYKLPVRDGMMRVAENLEARADELEAAWKAQPDGVGGDG
jgi:hypothetical protein